MSRNNLYVHMICHVVTAFFVCLPGHAQMTIHVINVGQGNCVFVEGPEVHGKRKTLIFDGGKKERGGEITDYLTDIGYPAASTTFDYMIVSHKDADHFEGFFNVLEAGYDIDVFYHNGSDKKQRNYDENFIPEVRKIARKIYRMKPGYSLNLGDGCMVTCAVNDGRLIGGSSVEVKSENDKSIGLVFKYGEFEFFSAGDLGGGQFSKDLNCTNRKTSQRNVESDLAKAMIRQQLIDRENGLEILHVSHHGSESSTNYEFMNLLSPSVAILSVGQNQSRTYQHPRTDIVDKVLMATAPCVTVPPALVLQTEGGLDTSKTSESGFIVGDIVIQIEKNGKYTISSTGVFEGPQQDETDAAGLPLEMSVDE
ncbi:MAG: hypothetical protein MI975_19680 [Cytophagales bacterium]|nr:hypothetical protein [Cytophagales bacterium]